MHQAIKILPPQLANQIAAGEVVERPASVVKELVENSLDADATQISIEIEQGGQKRILIRDNGNGIVKEELCLALSRHATSKISSIDDLEHITSMGFRGEALASISSVSRLTLTSKPVAQSEAWQAVAEGAQQQVDVTPAAHPNGTSIEVVDLFFNTPARRKFLRTSKTEFQHIEQIIKRIALTRPDVQFVLSHNQKVHCRYLKVKELSKRIEQVCGKNMLLHSRQIDYSFGDIKVSGWCSELGHGVATRDWQYTFVNGRMMKDKLLAHALRQAYEDTLPPQTFPCYVLFLQVSPQQMDVNVHPAKHEVRFHQARQVHDIVFKAVNNAISCQGDERTINDEFSAHQPNHQYIQPLKPSNLDPASTQVSSKANVPYRSNIPTRGDIKASNDFYASVHSQTQKSEDSPTQETQAQEGLGKTSNSVNLSTKNKGSGYDELFSSHHYLYNPPFLVLQQDENLCVVAIEALLTWVIRGRITRSTLSQPLLMPISIDNKSGIKQLQLKRFEDIHMMMSISHQKIILKQVPSELRHLPWASIFSQINIDKLENTESMDANNQPTGADSCKRKVQHQANIILSKHIANAWLNTLEVTGSMLDGWINEISEQSLNELCLQHAKLLNLSAWMDDIHLNK